jgi:uncharacterized membrane protein
MNKNRLEAFSDGVFAIIITIMILEIKTPKSGNWDQILNAHFLNVAIAYLVSFLLVTSFWISHHQIFQKINQIDVSFLWVNNLTLLPISFVPFATAWNGEFSNKTAPAVVYGIVYTSTILALYILSFSAQKLLSQSDEIMKKMNKQRIILIIVTIVGTIISIQVPVVSRLMVLFIQIYWIISANIQRKKK